VSVGIDIEAIAPPESTQLSREVIEAFEPCVLQAASDRRKLGRGPDQERTGSRCRVNDAQVANDELNHVRRRIDRSAVTAIHGHEVAPGVEVMHVRHALVVTGAIKIAPRRLAIHHASVRACRRRLQRRRRIDRRQVAAVRLLEVLSTVDLVGHLQRNVERSSNLTSKQRIPHLLSLSPCLVLAEADSTRTAR